MPHNEFIYYVPIPDMRWKSRNIKVDNQLVKSLYDVHVSKHGTEHNYSTFYTPLDGIH